MFLVFLLLFNTVSSKLLVISLDGFRHDYVDMYKDKLPFLHNLISKGTMVKSGLKNAYITKTFPNHWTLVTGVYEETHGIIDNQFYDREFDEFFDKSLGEKWWNASVPVWKYLESYNLRTASYFWPGSNVKNIHPTKFIPAYNKSVPLKTRINQVMKWFSEDNINVTFLYYSEPDSTGHLYGAKSKEMGETLNFLDTQIQYLFGEIDKCNSCQDMNVVLVSDHGMVNIKQDGRSYLYNFMNITEDMKISSDGSSVSIWCDFPDNALSELNSSKQSWFTVYTPSTMPKRFHYNHTSRVPDIFIYVQQPYLFIVEKKSYLDKYKGEHGYDNRESEMWPIFLGVGPQFSKGRVYDSVFYSVDIFNLICTIVDVPPYAFTNGSMSRVSSVLAKPSDIINYWFLAMIAVVVGSILCAIIVDSCFCSIF